MTYAHTHAHTRSQFCAWVHGIAHAARLKRGHTNPRIDPLNPLIKKQSNGSYKRELRIQPDKTSPELSPLVSPSKSKSPGKAPRGMPSPQERQELSFVQRLERTASDTAMRKAPYNISRQSEAGVGSAALGDAASRATQRPRTLKALAREQGGTSPLSVSSVGSGFSSGGTSSSASPTQARLDYPKFEPLQSHSPSKVLFDPSTSFTSSASASSSFQPPDQKGVTSRSQKARKVSQRKASERLSAKSVLEGEAAGIVGNTKVFTCADGITQMPYSVLGKVRCGVMHMVVM
jgi:hypothetical protein